MPQVFCAIKNKIETYYTMFTQERKINVGRCNGCPTRCRVDARAVVLYDNMVAYRPIIEFPGGRLKVHHGRKTKRILSKTYSNPQIALSYAITVTKDCLNYTQPPEPEKTSNVKTNCDGCSEKCELSAVKTKGYKDENIFQPKIGNKVIKKYICKRGTTKTVPLYKGALAAFMHANRISKLCDNQQYQHTK